jgi:hypothetical protein
MQNLEEKSMSTLRYNEISMKASHNSYQRDETIIEQITWDAQKNYDCGCGELELDVSQSDDGQEWSVGHKNSYDKNYKQLSQFFYELTVWSKKNPKHDVITLYLDLKHTATENFPSELDQYIKKCFLVETYTPRELMGNSQNLSQGALQNGWPTLDELAGKFIICLTGNKKDKAFYAQTSPKERLCFADKDTDLNKMPDSDERVFFNFHIYNNKKDEWTAIFKQCATKPNVIVRAYVANSESNWNNCLESGCNLIATDKISNYKWAKVGSSRFVELKPLV